MTDRTHMALMSLPVGRTAETWATFGVALPAGALPADAELALPQELQTDIKNVWPDGSARFVIVSTKIAGGTRLALTTRPRADRVAAYQVPVTGTASGMALAGTLTAFVAGAAAPTPPSRPTWPAVTLTFAPPASAPQGRAIGATYVATLPAYSDADPWLAGPLVQESRVFLTPAAGGAPHPTLRVRCDIRSYTGGGHRIDLCLENIVDVAELRAIEYALTITVANVERRYDYLLHCAFTRARIVLATEHLAFADVTMENLEPFYAAQALPRYLATVDNIERTSETAAFAPFHFGDLQPGMNAAGTRPELSTYPDWAIQSWVHQTPTQRTYTRRHGDLSASWSIYATRDPVHYLPVDLMLVPYWFDSRGGVVNGPANGCIDTTNGFMAWAGGTSAACADTAHFGSFALIPYLWTGDRFYVDQLRASAWYRIASQNPTYRENYFNGVDGSGGKIHQQENRGIGHSIREMHDAARWLPDGDPWQASFHTWTEINLAQLDFIATEAQYGANEPIPWMWPYKAFEDPTAIDATGKYVAAISHWEHGQQVIAAEWAHRSGAYAWGSMYLTRVLTTTLGMFTHAPDFNPLNAGPYKLGFATFDTLGAGSPFYRYCQTWAEMTAATLAFNKGGVCTLAGDWYGVQLRAQLILCKRREDAGEAAYAGAAAALDWIDQQSDGVETVADTVARRSGYAFAEDV